MRPNEIEGVLAHEIAHIGNGDMVTMTLLQGVINAFVIFFSRLVAFGVRQSTDSEKWVCAQLHGEDRARHSRFTRDCLILAPSRVQGRQGRCHARRRENMIGALRRLMTNRNMVETQHEDQRRARLDGVLLDAPAAGDTDRALEAAR
jgi:hypothetical protein